MYRLILIAPLLPNLDTHSPPAPSGPHCVRECGKSGEIWVALKGSIACPPAETPDRVEATHGNHDSHSLKRAKERVCCSAKALKQRYVRVRARSRVRARVRTRLRLKLRLRTRLRLYL